MKNRICIVTNAPVCCNPRVVKEADALAAAGYEVRVVASQHVAWAAEWDEALMRKREWALDSVRWDDLNNQTTWTRQRSAFRQRAFKSLAGTTNRWLVPERGYARLFDEQLRIASKFPADLYIAHNPQALPVAAAAARHNGVNYAFDSEDLHTGEFGTDDRNNSQYRLLVHLESKYLPDCVYVSAPSDLIADALVSRYKLRNTATIHNVFSWSERETIDGKIKDRRDESLSLYWYSQIIGLDRGLQDVIRAVSLLSTPVQIHFRGDVSESVKQELMELAKHHAVNEQLFFHSTVPPEELLSRASEHDVGLALEQMVNENRNLTITNKVFQYLLAGLSVAATSTAGQEALIRQCADSGFLYQPGNYRALAAGLQQLIDEPALLLERKAAALNAARVRWNWETESRKLLAMVDSAMQKPAVAMAGTQ